MSRLHFRHPRTACLAFVMAALMVSQPVSAGKPPRSAPTGEIYFELGGQDPLVVMSADGTGKSFLPGNIPATAMPSYFRHQGDRWFLVTTPLDDEFLPDGSQRTRLEAVREDGSETLRLFEDPSLAFKHNVKWSKDDLFISLTAVEWDLSVEPPELVGSVIYVLPVGFDEIGPIVPALPLRVAVDVETGSAGADLRHPVYGIHDWSPDNSAIAYSRWDDVEQAAHIFILDLQSGASRLLAVNASAPNWSPAGATICFRSYEQTRKGFRSLIQTIDADDQTGATRTTIIESQESVFRPQWSPTGEHIAYIYSDWGFNGRVNQDIYVVRADGRGATNLTRDTGDSVQFPSWR